MAKKNKSKSSKNGTATAPTEARQSGQGRSTIIAAAAIAALAAVAAVVMSRDPAAAHAQAALRCYASDACAAPQQWRQPYSHEACRSSGNADESCSAGTRRDQTSVGVLHSAALETWSSPRESGLSA